MTRTRRSFILVTIKDIAKAAGVAQGTVSNVLNGRGNVSSEKIRHVMEISEALGYIPNERAKILRKGRTNTLAVLMPDLQTKRYVDFYLSFKAYAETHGYTVRQYLPRPGSRDAEESAVQDARSDMVSGMAVFAASSDAAREAVCPDGVRPMRLLYVERSPGYPADYIGFDYCRAGEEMAAKALEKGYTGICLLMGSRHLSNEEDFRQAFLRTLEGSSCQVTTIQTDDARKHQNILQAFDATGYQAVFSTNMDFAQAARDILDTFHDQPLPDIYTVSPMFTMPETGFYKYELNYRLLGNAAAKRLIAALDSEGMPEEKTVLANTGFRVWTPPALPRGSDVRALNVLTLDSPGAYAMRSLSRLYTKQTGIPVNVTIYSYDEIYEAFNSLREDSVFDVLRLDVTWLSWFAEKILQPLCGIDPSVRDDLPRFLDKTPEQYAFVGDELYALPSTPSTQVLFYRRDLFESPICRRTYQEMYHQELMPPRTFDEFNRIGAFFTRSMRKDSPVDFGATLTLGSTGVAGSEYLARLFAVQEDLYDDQGLVRLDSEVGVHAMEQLIEVRRLSDPRHCTWWTNTADTFARGNVAMAILYSNFASPLLGHDSLVVDKIGYAMMPGGRPVIGGGALGVSRYSRQAEKALHFIRWMCSETVSSASTLLGGSSPCRESYDNYEIINTFPWLKLVKNCFSVSRGRRVPPGCAIPFDERRFMSIIGMAVKNACSGVQDPRQAMKYAQKLFHEQFTDNYFGC